MRIAIATSGDYPDGAPEDQLLRDALSARGIGYSHEVWDRFDDGFERYDAVLVRSVWDYALKRERFLNWATRCGAYVRLFNPADVLRWNSHKSYLMDFAKLLPVVETRRFLDYSPSELHGAGVDMGCSVFVAKPSVGAGAHGISRIDLAWPEEQLERVLDNLAKAGDYLLQPFVQSIVSRGECSAILFNGMFSHATLKTPDKGDFRVQAEHGGSMIAYRPTREELSFCEAVLGAAGDVAPLYARIDWLIGEDGGPLLGELELIEPSLYWQFDPKSAARFVDALVEKIHE